MNDRDQRYINRQKKLNNFEGFNISTNPVDETSNMATAELARYTKEAEFLESKIPPIISTIETLVTDASEVRAVKKSRTMLEGYANRLEQVSVKLEDFEIRASESPDNAAQILPAISKVKNQLFELCLNSKSGLEEAQDFIFSKCPDSKAGIRLGTFNNTNMIKLEPMKIPDYSGKVSEYKKWKQVTNELLPDNMSDAVKISRVTAALSGEATRYVGKIGEHLESWEAFWIYLDNKYLDEWSANFGTIGEMLDLSAAKQDDSLEDLTNKFGQILQAVLATKMNAEEIMTSWFFHIIPSQLKSQMLTALKVRMPEVKSYRWTQISKIWNEQISLLPKEDVSEIRLDTISYKSNAVYSHNVTDTNRQGSNSHNPHPKKNSYCAFCKENSHRITECSKYVTKEEQETVLKNNKQCLICARQNEKGHSCLGFCRCGCGKPRWRCVKRNMNK